ncbi:MAG: hypothetical protein HYV93_20400 [Candidatus Rokubacteria bacterium]|nr:hypothetical protein [Candidatus Rokubacteria bacterium]
MTTPTEFFTHRLFAPCLLLAMFGLGALTVAFLLVGPGMGPWADTLLTACFGWNAETRQHRLDTLILTLLQPPLFAAVVYFFYADDLRAFLRSSVDGQPRLRKSYSPGGLRGDGPTFAYEEVPVAPGGRRLQVTLADGHADRDQDRPRRFTLEKDVEIKPGQALLIEFSEDAGLTLR